MQIKLCRDGTYISKRIHQIVANEFCTKPVDEDNQYEVNHRDCDRKNNRSDNLEWVSHKENIRYAIQNGNHFCTKDLSGQNNPNFGNHILSEIYRANPELAKQKLARPGGQNGRASPISLCNKHGKVIKSFGWIGECASYLIDHGYTGTKIDKVRSNISQARKSGKIHLGFRYK